MYQQNFHAVFEHVTGLDISRENDRYTVHIDGQSIDLPEATNFEFRPSSPLIINHIYLGNETGGEELKFRLSFMRPRNVRLSNAAPRCYVYIE